MATKTKREITNPYVKYLVYAPIGAGKVLIERAKEIPGAVERMTADPRGRVSRTSERFAERGLELVTSIRSSSSTRSAVERAKSARSRVKAASTSVGKAVDAAKAATTSAMKKVG
jgi:hypothetical protein